MKNNNKFKWTVFFLARCADPRTVRFFADMVNELRSVFISQQLGIVMCVNVKATEIKLFDSQYGGENNSSRSGLTTLIYRLASPADATEPPASALQLLKEMPEFNIDDKEDVQRYFSEVVADRFCAEQYMLFTWDHGSPTGMFAIEPESAEPADIKMLTMSELSDALQGAFGKKIDVIAMMNCYVHTIDTGFTLSKNARYLTAPETNISLSGYHYSEIFQRLSVFPDMKANELANLITSTFANKADTSGLKQLTGIFTSRLYVYETIAKQINQLANILTDSLPDQKDVISRARAKCGYITENGSMIDFFFFFQQLVAEPYFRPLCSALHLEPDMIITASYEGDEFRTGNSQISSMPSGFSIYFPHEKERLDNAFSRQFYRVLSGDATRFVRTESWIHFLHSYLS